MARSDILGFVERLPIPDEDKVWDEVAGFLAKAAVERLSDLDPSVVLQALCGKDLKDKNSSENEDVGQLTIDDCTPADDMIALGAKTPIGKYSTGDGDNPDDNEEPYMQMTPPSTEGYSGPSGSSGQ